ncbi:MAG: hypothetical protein LBQ43_03805 [Holosporales bacterium]|nr:hypothetical protein [Holosporales bacterium]
MWLGRKKHKGDLRKLPKTIGYFANFYFFATHRVSDSHTWAVVKDCKVVRFFICGDGELTYNYGKLTPDELELGVDNLCYGCQYEEDWDSA